ncbi:hypothetical protein BJY52DRAFT_220389 [Lactarius psammicola]|nr:hypothetical protein BJY52DRAFT_220389 [Lactarius psammicola]
MNGFWPLIIPLIPALAWHTVQNDNRATGKNNSTNAIQDPGHTHNEETNTFLVKRKSNGILGGGGSQDRMSIFTTLCPTKEIGLNTNYHSQQYSRRARRRGLERLCSRCRKWSNCLGSRPGSPSVY